MATDRQCTHNCRLIINDNNSPLKFLIDTGAEVSVILPPSSQRKYPQKNSYLYAANHSLIKIYIYMIYIYMSPVTKSVILVISAF